MRAPALITLQLASDTDLRSRFDYLQDGSGRISSITRSPRNTSEDAPTLPPPSLFTPSVIRFQYDGPLTRIVTGSQGNFEYTMNYGYESRRKVSSMSMTTSPSVSWNSRTWSYDLQDRVTRHSSVTVARTENSLDYSESFSTTYRQELKHDSYGRLIEKTITTRNNAAVGKVVLDYQDGNDLILRKTVTIGSVTKVASACSDCSC